MAYPYWRMEYQILMEILSEELFLCFTCYKESTFCWHKRLSSNYPIKSVSRSKFYTNHNVKLWVKSNKLLPLLQIFSKMFRQIWMLQEKRNHERILRRFVQSILFRYTNYSLSLIASHHNHTSLVSDSNSFQQRYRSEHDISELATTNNNITLIYFMKYISA